MEQNAQPKPIDFSTTADRIDTAKRIVITTHARADGDAIGCVTAFQRVLRSRQKEAVAYVHEPVPERYRFLPDVETLREWRPEQVANALSKADLLVLLDTCAASQLGDVQETIQTASLAKLAVDHHVTRDPIVDEILLDERAGACAQIITQLCDRANWPIDKLTATLLYCGLATDTGWFRFSNADHEAFNTAARLIQGGAKPNELYEKLYLNDSEPRLRLIGAVLSSVELLADGRLAVVRITRHMLEKCGATDKMTEEIINEPQRIGSVNACVLFMEPGDDGPIRISFRSKHQVDVAAIARRFGGGGHARAAGAKMRGPLDAAYQQVVPAMIQAIESEKDDSK